MDKIISEKNYPIRNIWIFKQIWPLLIFLPIFLYFFISINNKLGLSSDSMLGFFPFIFIMILPPLFFLVLLTFIPIAIKVLARSNFHYSFEQHFIVLHQGIISKENRNIPYGRIQGVFVNQGLFDRVFNLASLTLEDFSQGGKSIMSSRGYIGSGNSKKEVLGFLGNKIHIPGLKKIQAEALKEIILQKIKENPTEDNQSGL